VLHHTANPDASWAPLSADPRTKWDRAEAGLSAEQVYAKRRTRLDSIMAYYRDQLGWAKGPHLFIDDLYIWLFTPMRDVGVHAAQGNSYRDSGGKLHYAIGIEVVGYYEKTTWPTAVAQNVATAVALLKDRLGTFDYVDGPWAGKISAHRHYNKPACPGARITPSYYMPILKAAWRDLHSPPPAPVSQWRTRYRAAVFEQQAGRGPVWGSLEPGALISADKDDYPEGTIHDAAGRGFLNKDDLERV
jgi:hypothetical protein